MGGCCGLESTELTVSTLVGYGGLENTDLNRFYFGGVVIIEELIFNIFSLLEGVLTELILTAFTLGGCGGHKGTDF